jgi:hypothetical protein
MSNVGDALTGSGGSGVTDPTGSSSFGDTPNLTDSDFAGLTDADIMGGSGGGPSEFSSFSDIANALSSGSPVGSSVGAQSASMTPPGTSAATGGDPTGATGGTQSNTAPGSSPNQNQQQQSGGGGGQHDPDHAPPSAVAELKTLLKGLSGQPTGPTGPVPQGGQAAPFALPTLAAGQTGAQSPRMPLPGVAAGQTGDQSPGSFYGTPVQPQTPGAASEVAGSNPADAAIPPGAAQQRTAAAAADDGAPAVDAQGNPVTAAGTPAADTPLPPARPGDAQTADAGGRQINVRKGGGAQPVASADLPTRVPHPAAALPTHKPGASPAPAAAASPGPATSSILNDISGISTGSPTALADLAQAAKVIAPLLPMIAGMFGGGGGGRRFGRFHGGRFTHGVGRGLSGFRGGMNAMHYHGGQHPAGRGAWPYHHPQFGWHMHGRPPGPGWLPLHPMDAQGLVGGGGQDGQDPSQQGPDPNAPPKETGRAAGTPDQVGSSGAIPGASAKDVDDYTRQVAQGYGIDPDVASRILAQESSYGQARHPGDDGTSFGPFQLHFAADGNAMGDQFRRDTGLDPRDPRTWKQQVDYAMMKASQEGWTPWTTSMKKLGMNQWSGITTNRRYAGRMSNKPLAREPVVPSEVLTAKLPPSSQPMVAGGP